MRCPSSERLFEWISVPGEMRFVTRSRLWIHTRICKGCRSERIRLEESWERLLCPEPDVTPSIIRVYSRLKRDETLILKGWKLGESRSNSHPWLFRGAVALSALAITCWVVLQPSPETTEAAFQTQASPLAQIRYENKNRIQVRYVKPELLQSIEFETASQP